MGTDRRDGRRRLVLPGGIQRIVRERHQLAAGLGRGALQRLDLVGGMEPGVVAQLAALGQVLGDPGIRRLLDQVAVGVELLVHLLAHLDGVAAIDEDRRLAGQDDREAGRAAEAGDPGQPFGPGRDILALMLVGAGHDEAGQAPPAQLGPQRLQPVGDGGLAQPLLARRLVEGSQMGFQLRPHLGGHQGHPGVGVQPLGRRRHPRQERGQVRRLQPRPGRRQKPFQSHILCHKRPLIPPPRRRKCCSCDFHISV